MDLFHLFGGYLTRLSLSSAFSFTPKIEAIRPDCGDNQKEITVAEGHKLSLTHLLFLTKAFLILYDKNTLALRLNMNRFAFTFEL